MILLNCCTLEMLQRCGMQKFEKMKSPVYSLFSCFVHLNLCYFCLFVVTQVKFIMILSDFCKFYLAIRLEKYLMELFLWSPVYFINLTNKININEQKKFHNFNAVKTKIVNLHHLQLISLKYMSLRLKQFFESFKVILLYKIFCLEKKTINKIA
jgi:hypothetical protein